MADIYEQLRLFIAKEVGAPQSPLIEQSQDLFADGWLDSLSLMRLIAHIEQTFQVAVDGSMVVPQNFATVDAISAFVQRLQRASPQLDA